MSETQAAAPPREKQKRPWVLRDGGCRCGQVRLRIDAAPLMTMACHCRGCQRMSAGAFSLGAVIPAAAFAVTRGEPVAGGLRGDTRHMHCPTCMSWLFTRAAHLGDIVILRPTMLDDPSGFEPFIETCTDEKLAWATTPAVHAFPQFPPPEAFGGLGQEYAAWRGDAS